MLVCRSAGQRLADDVVTVYHMERCATMDNVLEVVKTKKSVYIGYVSVEDAFSYDEHDNDVPCIIMRPVGDLETEIWIPTKNIEYRSNYQHVN